MIGLYLLARLLGRPTSATHVLGFAAAVLLAADPSNLFDVGFLLTFAAVFGLAAFGVPAARALRRAGIPGLVADALGATAGAELAVLPIQLFVFNVVPVVALLSNPFVVPLSSVFLFAGLLLLPLLLLSPASAALAIVPLRFLSDVLLALLLALDRLHAVRVVPTPAFALVAATAALLLVAGLTRRPALRRAALAGAAMVVLALVLARPVVAGAGHGRAAGARRRAGRRVAPRHARGPRSRGRRGQPGPRVRLRAPPPGAAPRGPRGGGLRRRRPHASAPRPRARAPRRPHVAPGRARRPAPGGAAQPLPRRVRGRGRAPASRRWSASAPASASRRRVSPSTCCTRGTARTRARGRTTDRSCCACALAGRTAILSGDVEALAESDLVASDRDLAADVLKVPHHGSRTSTSAAFLARVSPRLGLIGVGRRNRFGHPAADVVERLASAGVRTFRTDRDGDVALLFAGGPRPAGLSRDASRGGCRERAASERRARDRGRDGDGQVGARRRARRAARRRDRLGRRVRRLPRLRRRDGEARRLSQGARAAPPRRRARPAGALERRGVRRRGAAPLRGDPRARAAPHPRGRHGLLRARLLRRALRGAAPGRRAEARSRGREGAPRRGFPRPDDLPPRPRERESGRRGGRRARHPAARDPLPLRRAPVAPLPGAARAPCGRGRPSRCFSRCRARCSMEESRGGFSPSS